MEDALDDDSETDDDEEDGEDGFPGDAIGEDVLSSEEENDAGGEGAEAHEFIFFGEEADDARNDNEEGPPAVEEDVEIKKSEGVAAEDNTEGDDGDAPDDWF